MGGTEGHGEGVRGSSVSGISEMEMRSWGRSWGGGGGQGCRYGVRYQGSRPQAARVLRLPLNGGGVLASWLVCHPAPGRGFVGANGRPRAFRCPLGI